MPTTRRRPPYRAQTAIQSFIFDKSRWTVAQARAWLKRNGHYYRDVDTSFSDSEKRSPHIRFRQFDPPKNNFTFRTINFGNGIKGILISRFN